MRPLSPRVKPGPFDPGQFRQFLVPAGNILLVEQVELVVPAGTGHHLHQVNAHLEEVEQAGGALGDVEALVQLERFPEFVTRAATLPAWFCTCCPAWVAIIGCSPACNCRTWR